MLTTIRTLARVASNGTVTVPVGASDAGLEVEVTIKPAFDKAATDITQEEWVDLIKRTAGSIDDPTFVRPEQPPITPVPKFD